jgi:hypothetical protein
MGLIVAIFVVGAMSVAPASASGIQALGGAAGSTSTAATDQPNWNAGNLCHSISGIGTANVNCVSYASNSRVPLTYNFSAGKLQGGTVNVWIYGSNDCIYLNFHSFYTNITIHLMGSDYGCASSSSHGWGGNSVLSAGGTNGNGQKGCSQGSSWNGVSLQWAGGNGDQKGKNCAPGVNIVVNSESDILNLVSSSQSPCKNGGDYSVNVTIYGTTTVVNALQTRGTDYVNTTVTYIGTKPGFAVCPSGITVGRVVWTEASWGSHNTFATIFVDGTNIAHVPPNSPYTSQPMAPPGGASYGSDNTYASETTTTAPAGACQYLGQ